MKLSLFFLLLATLSACSQNNRTPADNKHYSIGNIAGIDSFKTPNETDKRLAAMAPGNDFIRNRARLWMQFYTNGKLTKQDSALETGMSLPCSCSLNKDTIKIQALIGFFGGMGIQTDMVKDQFQSRYLLMESDGKPYKYHANDKNFTGDLSLNNLSQSLILENQPAFKLSEQLSGYLTFATPKYFETTIANQMDACNAKGRLYFTCVVR